MKHAWVFMVVLLAAVPVWASSFHGYGCTQDCSGHEAGYDWADRNNIQNENDCHGNSNSFSEGCRAWVEEHQDNEEDN